MKFKTPEWHDKNNPMITGAVGAKDQLPPKHHVQP
jgi:hypothetical protein